MRAILYENGIWNIFGVQLFVDVIVHMDDNVYVLIIVQNEC